VNFESKAEDGINLVIIIRRVQRVEVMVSYAGLSETFECLETFRE
jgi:hypothetical protein